VINATAIDIPTQTLSRLCRRRHIRKLSLFGSAVRGEFSPLSDVDILVEYEPGQAPDLFEFYDIEQELSELLGGRRVDLLTEKSLHPYIRAKVLQEAQVQYERPG
jgi:uncharacterized protein